MAMELAVATAILLIAPMRISNLAGLHLKQHLVRPGGSRSLWLIDIPPEQVKNEVRLLYELSQRVTGVVDRFVRDFRPRFARPDNPYLFPVGSTPSSAITQSSIPSRQAANSTRSSRANSPKRICRVGGANDSASDCSAGH
jgi:hypothetical protein